MKLIIAAPAEVYRWEAEEDEEEYASDEEYEEELESDEGEEDEEDEEEDYDDDDYEEEEDEDIEGEVDELVSDPDELAQLSGLTYDAEPFADFFADDADTENIRDIGISGGMLSFEFSEEDQHLWGFTTYEVPRELDDDEMQSIIDYTLGQWSDGIAEHFASDYAEESGYYIQMVPPDDEVTYYYEED